MVKLLDLISVVSTEEPPPIKGESKEDTRQREMAGQRATKLGLKLFRNMHFLVYRKLGGD